MRSDIIINALDARGLFEPVTLGDAAERPVVVPRRIQVTNKKGQMEQVRREQGTLVLRALANDTGGGLFNNSSNFDEGFHKVGALPELYYVLGFSPRDLNLDGRLHALKVTLARPGGLTVQARRGYHGSLRPDDTSGQTAQIEEAVFSEDQPSDIPLDVHTEFFTLNETDARLSVLARVDLRLLNF